jgi:hypothetical protein
MDHLLEKDLTVKAVESVDEIIESAADPNGKSIV